MKIETFKKAIPYLIKARLSAMVVGPHGIGKSQVISQICEDHNAQFVDLRLGTMDVGDLSGLPDFALDEKGQKTSTTFMPPTWFPRDPNSKGILFLDELNRARRELLQACFQLVYDYRMGTYELPKLQFKGDKWVSGWYVASAINPNTEDYIVSDLSDKALMDRFAWIKLSPSTAEWVKYAEEKQFNDDVVRFIKDQPDLLRSTTEEFNFDDIKPSNRRWEQVSKLMEQKIPIHILQELCNGMIGTVATAAFMTSLKDVEKPFSAEDILENYSKFAKKIEKFSQNETGGRLDILKHTGDNLLKHLQECKKKLTKEQEKNLTDYLKVIPKDLTFSIMRELYFVEIVRPCLDKDEELIKMLKKAKKAE